MTKEERCSYCNAPNNGTCAYPSEGKPGCLLEAHRKRMRQALTSKPRFTTDDLRSLMELPDWHRPDEAAIRDFLGWIDNTIETSPSETNEKRDRYCPDCGITHCFPVEPSGPRADHCEKHGIVRFFAGGCPECYHEKEDLPRAPVKATDDINCGICGKLWRTQHTEQEREQCSAAL